MAQSKKHRSRREVLLKSCTVGRTASGSGEQGPRKKTLEQIAYDRAFRVEERMMLKAESPADAKARLKRLRRIANRVRQGGGLSIVKPKIKEG
jgi:hypothetical protein